MKYSLHFVDSECSDWDLFVDWSVEYIEENWERVDRTDYDQELRRRFEEGNRFCILLKYQNKFIGLANLYAEEQVLHIAEFTIRPEYRGQGHGCSFAELVTDWAKKNSYIQVSAEVDRDQNLSNLFWQKLQWQCDRSGQRNRYYSG